MRCKKPIYTSTSLVLGTTAGAADPCLAFISSQRTTATLVPTDPWPASPPTEPAHPPLPRPKKAARRFRPFFPLRISRPGLHPPTATTTAALFPFRPPDSPDPRPDPVSEGPRSRLIIHFGYCTLFVYFFSSFLRLGFPGFPVPAASRNPLREHALSLIFYNITLSFFSIFAFSYAIAPH